MTYNLQWRKRMESVMSLCNVKNGVRLWCQGDFVTFSIISIILIFSNEIGMSDWVNRLRRKNEKAIVFAARGSQRSFLSTFIGSCGNQCQSLLNFSQSFIFEIHKKRTFTVWNRKKIKVCGWINEFSSAIVISERKILALNFDCRSILRCKRDFHTFEMIKLWRIDVGLQRRGFKLLMLVTDFDKIAFNWVMIDKNSLQRRKNISDCTINC